MYSHRYLTLQAGWFTVLVSGLSCLAIAQEPGLTVRDVHVGFVTKGVINDRAAFRSTVPSVVLSQRPSPAKPADGQPQPLGVITFAGTPAQNVDVMLEYEQSTKLLGRWPHTEARSTRSLWRKLNLLSGSQPLTTPFPTASWLNPLRNSERLFVEKDKSVEKLILYDMSMKFPSMIELEAADEGYQARHLGPQPLRYVTVYRPVGDGKFRMATTKELPASSSPSATPPAEGKGGQPMPPVVQPGGVVGALQGLAVAISGVKPASPETPPTGAPPPAVTPAIPSSIPQHAIPWVGEPQTPDQLVKAWDPILREQGLEAAEVEYAASILKENAFEKDSARIVVLLDPATIEKLVPLEVTPQPDRLVRVWLMIIDGADPEIKKRIGALITQLGDTNYSNRMAAKQELLQLGPTAIPELTAQKSHQDAEIAFRIEELLEEILNPDAAGQPGQQDGENVIGI